MLETWTHELFWVPFGIDGEKDSDHRGQLCTFCCVQLSLIWEMWAELILKPAQSHSITKLGITDLFPQTVSRDGHFLGGRAAVGYTIWEGWALASSWFILDDFWGKWLRDPEKWL